MISAASEWLQVVKLETLCFDAAFARRGDERTALTIALEHRTAHTSGDVAPAPARMTRVRLLVSLALS